MASVRYQNVNKFYGDHLAVGDLSLDIRDGEFITLVGGSGCGKSTALRMLAGLESISGGEIYIGDRRINSVPARQRNVAMVFQNYALYPHMSVFDNIAFSLRLSGTSKEEIKRRVHEAAEILGIQQFLSRRPGQLSGGQRQRVAMGRAIVREPEVYLFDEPLSNLDAKLRVEMRKEIRNLHRKLGVTSIYVTHDQTEAMTLPDRIAILKHGVLQQFATPDEVYRSPANRFVGTFIGSPAMNVAKAVVKRGSGEKLEVSLAGLTLPVIDEYAPALESFVGESLLLGVRPEHIRYGGENSPDRSTKLARFKAKVDVIEHTGSDCLLDVDAQGAKLRARVDARRKPVEGGEIDLQLDLATLFFFDPETERSLHLH